jgi:hypothetical protein
MHQFVHPASKIQNCRLRLQKLESCNRNPVHRLCMWLQKLQPLNPWSRTVSPADTVQGRGHHSGIYNQLDSLNRMIGRLVPKFQQCTG